MDIIVGTVLGSSEYVADAVKEYAEQQGIQSTIHLTPRLEEIHGSGWLIVTSTHGAGELPDNLVPFYQQLAKHPMQATKFGVIGLGDSSYDTYNFAALTMHQRLLESGGTAVFEPILIDTLHEPTPEEVILGLLRSYQLPS